MWVIHLDLDNTLIYSYKHVPKDAVCSPGVRDGEVAACCGRRSGGRWINVEIYQGREISYITEKTQKLLGRLKERCLIVPTTTRTQEQYDRIRLNAGRFEYSLVCNGGVLLVNGAKDGVWYQRSRELVSGCAGEMRRAIGLLEREPLRKFELRFIEELFLFTKCEEPDTVVLSLKTRLDAGKVDVFRNGEKVYVVPKKLNKGTAVQRFREYIGADEVIAAGDSEFDVSMAEAADVGIVPAGFCRKYEAVGNLTEMKGEDIFSEEMLVWMENYLSSKGRRRM